MASAQVENAKKVSPAVVEELVPDRMSYGDIQQVLRNLLKEGVPIRNMPAILEALADHAHRVQLSPDAISQGGLASTVRTVQQRRPREDERAHRGRPTLGEMHGDAGLALLLMFTAATARPTSIRV